MSAPPESSKNKSVLRDRCGHPIDPDVGYARGNILSSSLDEFRRYQHALRLIQIRAAQHGRDSFYNFTGLQRHCNPGDSVYTAQDEWLAPAFFQDELKRLTLEHLGALPEADIAVFNRASSGIVATCLALCASGSTVIAVTPGKPHPSIPRGVALARASLVDAGTLTELDGWLNTGTVSLVIITGVSSELDVIEADFLQAAVNMVKRKGVPSLLDDAYGARLRPIVYHQPKTLETGVDIGITSCDKAGLGGPRAGLMAGRPDLVNRIQARAAELGLEARPTLAASVCHSLQNFNPLQLQQEVELGQKIYQRLCGRYGADAVRQTGLGASITEEDAWNLVRSLGMSKKPLPLVPAEVTAGIGMYWLLHHGMITVNALGQPGSRVSLRFKPKPQEVERFGGLPVLMAAIDDGILWVSQRADSIADMRRLLFGLP